MGPHGNYPGRIDRQLALVVVTLDVAQIDSLGNAGGLVEVTQVAREIAVVFYPAQVALEVPEVDRVESHKGREKPPVSFGQFRAREIASRRELVFKPVEGLEQRCDGLLVCLLRRRKARLVNSVVD